MPATVGIYFDNRMSKEGEWYVKWVVYFEKKQRYFSTGIKLDSEDVAFLKKYKSGLTGGVRDEYRRNLWNMFYGSEYIDPETGRKEIGKIAYARGIVSGLGSAFTFEKFAFLIANPTNPTKNSGEGILSDMIDRSKELYKSGNSGDAEMYECAVTSLTRFNRSPILQYQDVTKEFLEKYERWMLKEGKAPQPKKDENGEVMQRPGTPASPTTVGMHIRQVRAIYNVAIDKNKSLAEYYPFGPNGYIIPSGRNIKKAIDIEDIEKIIVYSPKNDSEALYRDLWLFSYLSNGINFIDMLNITWSDMDTKRGTIEFVRAKTKGTKKSKIPKIQIDLFPLSTAIIERWGDKKNKYIFPFFKEGMLPEKKSAVKKQVVKNTNKYIRRIAGELGIASDITTYTARHTFATVLLRSEAPLAFISQKLSHESIKTTQDYFSSFEDVQSKKYLAALLPKKKGE